MITVLFQPGDITADSVRRAVETVFARPEYRWAPAAHPLHWVREFLDWLGRLNTQQPFVYQVIFWVAVVVLVGLLTHLAFTAWRIYRSTVALPADAAPRLAPVRGEADQHLARAETLAREGHYTEALAHRFLVLLLRLDRFKRVTFHPAKTPGEYVREARLDDEARAWFANLVSLLYAHVFGAAPCDAQAYRSFGAVAGMVEQHAASH